jgi:hypothetical protein
MITETFPNLTERGLDLEPAGRRFRGASPPPLRDRVQLGGPQFVSIDERYHPDDADLQAFLRDTRHRWVLAHLSLTFPFADGPEISTAELQAHLSDDGPQPETIAFSLLPTRAESNHQQTREFTLAPKVDVAGIGGIELGSIGTTSVQASGDAFLSGGPELSPTPRWQFKRTATQRIEGTTRLSMIIQIPRQRVGAMTIDLAATVTTRFRRRQVPLDGSPNRPDRISF